MPLKPEEIRDRTFPVSRQGYDRGEVDDFLVSVASEYARALEAGSSEDPYGDAGRQIAEVLRSATESAASITGGAQREAAEALRQAHADADDIRRAAAVEASATMTEARDAAGRIRVDIEEWSRGSADESERLRAAAQQHAREVKRSAAAEAASTLESAREKAVALLEETERRVAELTATAEREYHDRLDHALERHAQLEAHEQALTDKVREAARALQKLWTELVETETPEEAVELPHDGRSLVIDLSESPGAGGAAG